MSCRLVMSLAGVLGLDGENWLAGRVLTMVLPVRVRTQTGKWPGNARAGLFEGILGTPRP